MVKKGLNKHPGGKKPSAHMDHTEVKKFIQHETGVVIGSIDKDTKTISISKSGDLAKIEESLGKVVGGWTMKQG